MGWWCRMVWKHHYIRLVFKKIKVHSTWIIKNNNFLFPVEVISEIIKAGQKNLCDIRSWRELKFYIYPSLPAHVIGVKIHLVLFTQQQEILIGPFTYIDHSLKMILPALDVEKFQKNGSDFIYDFLPWLMITTRSYKTLWTSINSVPQKTSGFGFLPMLLTCVLSVFIVHI